MVDGNARWTRAISGSHRRGSYDKARQCREISSPRLMPKIFYCRRASRYVYMKICYQIQITVKRILGTLVRRVFYLTVFSFFCFCGLAGAKKNCYYLIA